MKFESGCGSYYPLKKCGQIGYEKNYVMTGTCDKYLNNTTMFARVLSKSNEYSLQSEKVSKHFIFITIGRRNTLHEEVEESGTMVRMRLIVLNVASPFCTTSHSLAAMQPPSSLDIQPQFPTTTLQTLLLTVAIESFSSKCTVLARHRPSRMPTPLSMATQSLTSQLLSMLGWP